MNEALRFAAKLSGWAALGYAAMAAFAVVLHVGGNPTAINGAVGAASGVVVFGVAALVLRRKAEK